MQRDRQAQFVKTYSRVNTACTFWKIFFAMVVAGVLLFALTNYDDDASLMTAAFGNTKYPSLAYDAALNDIVEYLAYTPNRKDELKSLLVDNMMQSASGGTSPSDCLDIRPVLQYAATLFTEKGGTT